MEGLSRLHDGLLFDQDEGFDAQITAALTLWPQSNLQPAMR